MLQNIESDKLRLKTRADNSMKYLMGWAYRK